MLDVSVTEYTTLDGSKIDLIKQVGNGLIVKRFDLTPTPRNQVDIVCPHFLELKWALGCPYDCAWCYLRGTLRHYPRKKSPTYRNYKEIELHIRRFFRATYPPRSEILNTGEVADSLMSETTNRPFSKFIIPLFETQNKHKVLFLTKGTYIKNLLDINPHNQAIISFSLNAEPVASKWERAPLVKERIRAARKVFDAGYETRIRIDPIVPYPKDTWQKHYRELVDQIFSEFFPQRITLGSLRGLQSTINEAEDKSWVDYLREPSKWGRRILFKHRLETFAAIIYYLKKEYDYTKVALCKEPVMMWENLGMDWKKCACNCVW